MLDGQSQISCCSFSAISGDPAENREAFDRHECLEAPRAPRDPKWHESLFSGLFSGEAVLMVLILCLTTITVASIIKGDWSWLRR